MSENDICIILLLIMTLVLAFQNTNQELKIDRLQNKVDILEHNVIDLINKENNNE